MGRHATGGHNVFECLKLCLLLKHCEKTARRSSVIALAPEPRSVPQPSVALHSDIGRFESNEQASRQAGRRSGRPWTGRNQGVERRDLRVTSGSTSRVLPELLQEQPLELCERERFQSWPISDHFSCDVAKLTDQKVRIRSTWGDASRDRIRTQAQKLASGRRYNVPNGATQD